MANPQKKNPTWFFVAVIIGAGVLLLALFFGLVPEDEPTNTNVAVEEEEVADTMEGDVDEEDVEVEEEPIDSGFVLEGDDIVGGPDIVEGILSQSFASGGQLTRTPEDMEGIIRHSISAKDEGTVIIDGIEGMRVSGVSAKDGTPLEEIHIKKDGFIYVLTGSEEFLMDCEKSGMWE